MPRRGGRAARALTGPSQATLAEPGLVSSTSPRMCQGAGKQVLLCSAIGTPDSWTAAPAKCLGGLRAPAGRGKGRSRPTPLPPQAPSQGPSGEGSGTLPAAKLDSPVGERLRGGRKDALSPPTFVRSGMPAEGPCRRLAGAAAAGALGSWRGGPSLCKLGTSTTPGGLAASSPAELGIQRLSRPPRLLRQRELPSISPPPKKSPCPARMTTGVG